MARKLCVAAVLLALIVAGDTLRAQDGRGVVQAAVKAMGAANLKSIQYSGTGWNAAIGQSFSPQDDWPHFEVTRYARTIDYDARSSREEMTRRQGNNPPRGGGGTPLQGEQQQVAIVSGNYAWNLNDQGDPRRQVAHNMMEITVNNVQPNVSVAAMAVPDAVQKATAPRERVESQKLADGVWFVAGGSHNSLAIDFRDYAVVIEAPL